MPASRELLSPNGSSHSGETFPKFLRLLNESAGVVYIPMIDSHDTAHFNLIQCRLLEKFRSRAIGLKLFQSKFSRLSNYLKATCKG
jgi:hypothetical protein